MAQRRGYTMAVRAETTAATRRRIVEAVIELHNQRFSDEITLEDIAAEAGVSVPTVLRHHGSREQLLWAAAALMESDIKQQRWAAPVGDIGGAVDNLLDHYEEQGAGVIRLLAQEERVPQLRQMLDRGRALHREWVERTFAPLLPDGDTETLISQLVVLTDVYAWKLLRVDRGYDRATTHTIVVEMIEAVLRGRKP